MATVVNGWKIAGSSAPMPVRPLGLNPHGGGSLDGSTSAGKVSGSSSGILSGLGAALASGSSNIGKGITQLADKVVNSSAGKTAVDNNLATLFNAYSTSALKQNEEWNKAVMQYNSDEAEKQRKWQEEREDLAWSRNETSAQKQMDFQKEMYYINQDYETEMANTQYQRAVDDMRKAGINPLYASNVGGSIVPTLSSPSGASASASVSSGSSASASNFDFSNSKNSDKSSIIKDLFGDLFSDYLSSATKILSTQMTNDTAITTSLINGGANILGKLIPW